MTAEGTRLRALLVAAIKAQDAIDHAAPLLVAPPVAPPPSKFEDAVIVRLDDRGVGINAAGAYVARKKAIDPRGLYAAWADARKIAKLSGSPARLPQATPPPVVVAPAVADASLEQLVALFGQVYPEALDALRAIWTAKAPESSCKAFVHALMGYRK